MVFIDRYEFDRAMKLFEYTQKDLADIMTDMYRVKVNYRGLNKMINKKQNWTIEVAYALSDILELPFEQLFKFDWE